MSLAVVIRSPRICSGLAYSGVKAPPPIAVRSRVPSADRRSGVRDAEVEELRRARGVTRMFLGLRSRWTTRFRCAYGSAAQTVRKIARRSGTARERRAHQTVSGCPSTYSITRKGSPSSVLPPSRRRAMFGCSRPARIWRSWRKRRRTVSVSMPRRTTFTATRFWNGPSALSPRYTVPMPPCPSSLRIRQGPTRSRTSSGAAGGVSRNPPAESSSRRSDATSASSAASPAA